MTAYDDAVLALSPLGYYKLTSASSPGTDSSGNGRHLTNDQGTITEDDPLAPVLEGSLFIAERVWGNDLIMPNLSGQSASIIGFGVVQGSVSHTLHGTNAATVDHFRLRTNADRTMRAQIGATPIDTQNPVSAGAHMLGYSWNHSAQECTFFVDGEIFEVVPASAGFFNHGFGPVIGARSAGASDYWNERISHVSLFEGTLSEPQVAALWEAATQEGGPGQAIYMASDESLGDWKREPENGSHASAIADESDAQRLVLFASDFPGTYRGKWEEPEVTPASDGTYIAHLRAGRFGTVNVRARLRIYEGGGSTPGAGTLLGEVNQVLDTSGYQNFNVNIDEPTDWNNLYGELVGEQP